MRNDIKAQGPKLVFELKQDTPMVHFQSRDSGVALRATEVKPKLDRFIQEWCKRNHCELPEEYFLKSSDDKDTKSKKNKSLRYKMKISAIGRYERTEKPTAYFGGNTSMWLGNKIQMEIVCFIPELRQIMEKCMETFFVLHNFGTRQRRGTGGFTLRDTTSADAERILKNWYESKTLYKVDCSKVAEADGLDILDYGNYIYKVMKSGINLKEKDGKQLDEAYVRGFLTIYFQQLEIGSDKKALKEKEVAPAINTSGYTEKKYKKMKEYQYTRAMLGVAGNYSFLTGNQVWNKKINKRVDEKHTILISNKEIDRFSSPIMYKVVGKVLFIIVHDIPRELYGKSFRFKNKDTNKFLFLSTPKEFDIGDFMRQFVEYYNKVDVDRRTKYKNTIDSQRSKRNKEYRAKKLVGLYSASITAI